MVKTRITGRQGWIGKNVEMQLISRGVEIVEDLKDVSDNVILLGRDGLEFTENLTLIHGALLMTTCKVLYISSSAVHSKKISYYRTEKRCCEEICQVHNNNRKNIIIVRPYNVYGPGQPDNFVIPTIINQALRGDVVKLKDKFAERNFVYVKDTAKALVDIALSDNLLADTIELGHEKKPIWRVVEMVGKILGKKLTIDAPAANEGEHDSVYMPLDSNKWPIEGFISMEEGLKETIEFYKKGCP